MLQRTTLSFGLALMALLLGTSSGAAQGAAPAYLDPQQPLDARVADLIGRMTLEEKVGQMMHEAPAIPHLKVPEYNWWNEALHGVARAGKATVFPQAIGLAATFDTELIHRVATAISDEARAKHHSAAQAGLRSQYQGLTFWSPNVNLFRDPRWGRGQETYGEDPFLSGAIGTAFVEGLQGDHPRYLKTAACAKHYVVHSGPEGERHTFNAVASPKDLNETYLPAFRALVDAGVESVMCAYNRTNGEVCCGSDALLGETLFGSWGFTGHVVSDCGAINDFHATHKVTSDAAESAALAVKKGTHLNCGRTYAALVEAVERDLVTEEEIDASLHVLLRTRFKLGLFDPEEDNPYTKIPVDVVRSEEHVALARETAARSVVLLKNEGGVLPIRKDLGMIYVTGPQATSIQVLLGNYYGVSSELVTIMEGVVGKVGPMTKLPYRQGALLDRPNVNPIDWYTGSARAADVTIAVVGISQLIEGEEGESIASPHKGDRVEIGLPPNQLAFLKQIRDAARKLVVVVTGGSAIAIPEVHEMADAVLYAWYPGEQGGNGVADVLFGDHVPSGRLPVTVPRSTDQLPAYEDYAMAGRTYRYMTEEPLYPFGFGLSFTSFEYGEAELSTSTVKAGESLDVSVPVKNIGGVAADEIVQLYVTDLEASVGVPRASLQGIQRVSLEPSETRDVSFTITPQMLELVNEQGQRLLEKGQFKLTIGGASPAPRAVALGAPRPATAVFTVE